MRTFTLLGCFALAFAANVRVSSVAAPPEAADVAPPPREADTATSRSLRWTIRFKVQNGKDYLEQLGLLGAEVLVFDPADESKSVLIPDAKKPEIRHEAKEKEMEKLLDHVRFKDERKEAVEAVAGVLELTFKPRLFFAFIPKELETELARKEKSYRNRRIEDIKETVFLVVIRGGKAEIIVDDQRVKR
jgi:hypothetical protein